MNTPLFSALRFSTCLTFGFVLADLKISGQVQDRETAVTQMPAPGQPRESIAGEAAAEALKRSLQAEAERYNLRVGPVRLQTGARLNLSYVDNVFYSQNNQREDLVINPEVSLAGFVQVSELNALRFSVGLGYEYYTKNSSLNSDAPLVNPDSELVFNVFAGDFRLRFHEKFLYQETLLYNTSPNRQDLLFNFNDAAEFSRWDNLAGFKVDWDLNKVIITLGYDHENFNSNTREFDYLTRVSELFAAGGAFLIGDQASVGLESQAGLHDFDEETVMNDHWQLRVGPFVELKTEQKINVRVGGGYDTAEYGGEAENSDFDTYYAYGRVEQETRLFKHSLGVGREHFLGDNANNLDTTYVRYSITAPIVEHLELGANITVHFAEEFGGDYQEDFTYYRPGLKLEYQIHKYWRTQLRYEFMMRDSDVALRDFERNRLSLGVEFLF
jgi:hypothetical protein